MQNADSADKLITLLCANVEQTLSSFERDIGTHSRLSVEHFVGHPTTLHPPAERLISLSFSELPKIERILDKTLEKMAEIALVLWPNWPVSNEHTINTSQPNGILPNQTISAVWLKAAAERCKVGKLPLLKNNSRRHFQAAQLALAIAPQKLLLCVALDQPDYPVDRLLGFASAVEWLTEHTHAQLRVLIPKSLAQESALERILYAAYDASTEIFPSTLVQQTVIKSNGFDTDKSKLNHLKSYPAEARHRLLPFVGQPHPYSPGEQALAKALQHDTELGELFGFNQYVVTKSGQRYLVDLLWQDGRLVVEVDSYTYHSTAIAFAADRERDYQLLISGYRVLRITHDEAIGDTQAVIVKIHQLVQLLQC